MWKALLVEDSAASCRPAPGADGNHALSASLSCVSSRRIVIVVCYRLMALCAFTRWCVLPYRVNESTVRFVPYRWYGCSSAHGHPSLSTSVISRSCVVCPFPSWRLDGSRHLIHRDVKPANFVLGPGRGCQAVFCIDFGLSTRYRHPRTLQHIPYRDGRSLTGTPR